MGEVSGNLVRVRFNSNIDEFRVETEFSTLFRMPDPVRELLYMPNISDLSPLYRCARAMRMVAAWAAFVEPSTESRAGMVPLAHSHTMLI